MPGLHAFCTPGDIRVLRLALDGTERFRPMTDQQKVMAIAQV